MIESEYLIDHIQYSSRKFSNRIAIIEEETSKQLTYVELWNKIETVSEILRTIIQIPTSEPLTPLVSILTRRSLASVVGKLSILNVGGAYVPVDPSFPHERQIHIFTHSKSQLLLVDESNVNYVKSFPVDLPPIIVMDNEGNIVEINSALQLLPSQIPRLYPFESLAYVLYTSGSTGKPKGVMVHNSGLVNVLKYFVNRLHLTEHDSVLALTTFCFDISMLELFMPLFIGGKVVIVSEKSQKNPVKIIQTLEKYRITTMQATPTTYEMLFSCGWNGNKNIQFLVGGEAFRLKLLPLISNCKKCFNVYGPTETTIWSSCYEFPPLLSNEINSKKYNNINNDQEKDKPMMLIPIGQPIDQTIFYLVNEEMKEITEDSVEGELLIGGIGVASGYLHAPDLTSVRFFDDPFQSRIIGNDAIDHRVYRTGDIVKRIRIDDQIQYVFCRRIDDQVKVNGYRIELREIEIVFENYPKIHQIIVLVIQDQLVAFVLLQSITIFDYIAQHPLEYHSLIEELTNHGKKFLPIYMIPKYFQIMKEFPTTANGKLDKLALSNSFQIPSLNSVSNPAAASTSPKGQISPMKSAISPKSILLTPIRLASPLLGKETNSPSRPDHIDRGSAISMVGHVSDIIHQVTGRKPMVHSTFASVGIDSLAAMMFKNVLSQSLENIEINQQDLYDVHVTIESFCDQLYQQVLQEKPNLLIQLKINRSKDHEKQQQQERRQQESLQQDTDDLEDLESTSSRKQRKQKLLQIQNKNNNFISKLLLKNRILLDGIRGFIALLVLLDHYYLDTKYFGIRGHCDTLIFIMLTGITMEFQNLVDEENQRNEEEQNDEDYYRHRHQHHQRNVNHNKNEKNVQWNWKQFLFTRFIGLFPIYWLTLILSIPRLYFLLPKYSSMSSEEWNISISLYILALQTWTKDINTDLFHGVYYVCLIWGVFLMYAYLRSMVFSPSPSSKLWQYYLKRVFFFVLFLIFVWFIHLQTAIGFFHPFFGMIYFLLGLFTTRLFLSMKSFMDSWLKDEDDDHDDGYDNTNERDYEYVHVYGWNIYHPAARSSKSSSIAFEWQGFRAPVTASSKKRSRSDDNHAREEELQSLLPPTISATSSSYSPSTALLSSTPSPLSTGKGYESFSENMKKSTDETTNSMKIMKNNQDHYKPKLFPKKPSYFLPILIDFWTITFLYLMFNPFLFSNRHTSMYYFIDRFLFLYGFPGMFMILFLLLFYQSIYYSVERSFFTIFLTELRIFSLLGECSYPLYLIQFIMVKFWFALAMDGIRDGVFPYTRDYVLHGIHMIADSTDSSTSSRMTSHHHHSSTHPHSSSSSAAATAAAHHAGHERSLINVWYMRLIAIILTIGVAVMIQRIFQEKLVGRLHYHLIQYWRKHRE